MSHKQTNGNRLACPSLESSPFSSPASMELTAVSTSNTSSLSTTSTHVSTGRATNYYLPAFTLNAQGKVIGCTSTGSGTIGPGPTTVSVVNMPQLVHSNQMLPSVDTLLFTTQTGNRFFSGKGPVGTATAAATPHLTWSHDGGVPSSTPQRSPVS